MLIGSIIGSGIFFKNNNVFEVTNFSAISTGIAWILSSVISLLLALSFSEIGRIKTKTNETGTSLWIKILLPKNMRLTLRPFYSIFYFSVYALILGYLASKFFFDALGVYDVIDVETISPAIHMIIGLSLTIILFISHYLERKTMSYIQIISSVLKLLPLFVMIIAGLILFNDHHYIPTQEKLNKSQNAAGENLFKLNRSFNFNNVIIAIPMILFAYDAFTSATTMQHRIKDGEKRMPLLITMSMLFIVTLYITLTTIQLIRGTGSVAETMKDIFPTNVASHIQFILLLFVTISVFGALNGFSFLFRVNIENQIKDNGIFLGRFKDRDERKVALIISILIVTILASLSFIYGFINDAIVGKGIFDSSDLLINYMSEIIPVLSFFIYGVIVFSYMLQRHEHKHNKINDVLFIVCSIIGATMSIVLMTYEIVYIIPIKPFVDGWTESNIAELISFVLIVGISTMVGQLNYKKIIKQKSVTK